MTSYKEQHRWDIFPLVLHKMLCLREKGLQIGQWSPDKDKDDPVKGITITRSLSSPLLPHSPDREAHDEFCRFVACK